MRAIFLISVMVWAACSDGAGRLALDNPDAGDAGDPLVDSEMEVKDTESSFDSDSEITDSDTDVLDSETGDPDSVDTETSDTETGDSETESVEFELCTFGEKSEEKCENNIAYVCQENPEASTIEMVWYPKNEWSVLTPGLSDGFECPLGTECQLKALTQGGAKCVIIGDCFVSDVRMAEDRTVIEECVYDPNLGGGVWSVLQDCAAEDKQAWYIHEVKEYQCVPLTWEECPRTIGVFPVTTRVYPGNEYCLEDVIYECTVDSRWVREADCSQGGLQCGLTKEGAVCYDACEFVCLDEQGCKLSKGVVHYNSGECLNPNEVCCQVID